jgi:uncharacterized phage protein gp47/JayE
MTTYPLPTLSPTIDATGISAPAYPDIYASLQASYLIIYPDAVLDPSSQDGQWIAVIAQAISDNNNAIIAAYNNMSPATAQGAGLSSNVKINGLARLIPSNSTIPVSIVGQVGTIITNGLVGDGTNQFALPSPITIPIGGSIVETATCTVQGAILSPAGAMQIVTPTAGWQTATATAPATPGAPVENDATLRQRQSVSTSLPAQSVIDAIYAALDNLTGVQLLKIYQNDTNTTDGNGVPPHSIACVVSGGDAVTIAQTIALKKGPGCGTYGTTSELVVDPKGIPVLINFFIPGQLTILIAIGIKALAGYQSTTGALIIAALVTAINNEGIGANAGLLSLSSLYSVAYSVPNANTFNVTSLAIAISPGSPASTDLTIPFNDIPVCVTGNVTLSVT